MKNIILASTSSLFGQPYLAYLQPVIEDLFAGIDEVIFIPYARPGGLSHDEYSQRAAAAFSNMGIRLKGLHSFDDPATAILEGKAFFTGGGNTFLLVKQLLELRLMSVLREEV
jgi:dipeptidase E